MYENRERKKVSCNVNSLSRDNKNMDIDHRFRSKEERDNRL